MKLPPLSKLTLASLFLFCIPAVVLAAPYVPLEPLPFLSQVQGTKLPDLLQALFQLLIIGGAGVAVLMVTIGGIQYMTGEAIHQKSEGKARIQNSVMGLILLLFIYLLLRTINPQLLNFNLGSITPVGNESNAVVLQARATEAQRNATAATPGPSSPRFYDTNAPSGSISPSLSNSGASQSQSYQAECLPGDYCSGSSGFTNTSSQPRYYISNNPAPVPDFTGPDYAPPQQRFYDTNIDGSVSPGMLSP